MQILYFKSPTCAGCKITSPIVEKLQAEGLPIKTIDAFKEPETANRYGVMSLPNFIVVDGVKALRQEAKVLNEIEIRSLL